MKMFRILGKRGRITIPCDIRMRVGFSYNDVLSFEETQDGKAVVVKREKLCDNCRGQQPQTSEKDRATVTLTDFLNSLPKAQKKAALRYLNQMHTV